MTAVVTGLPTEHPTWCEGGPCEMRLYANGYREVVHQRDVPPSGPAGMVVWLSSFWSVDADGKVSDGPAVIGLDVSSCTEMTPGEAEQLARDLTEAARLLHADIRSGAR